MWRFLTAFKRAVMEISLFFKKTPIMRLIGRYSKFAMSRANLERTRVRGTQNQNNSSTWLLSLEKSDASLFQSIFKGLPGEKLKLSVSRQKTHLPSRTLVVSNTCSRLEKQANFSELRRIHFVVQKHNFFWRFAQLKFKIDFKGHLGLQIRLWNVENLSGACAALRKSSCSQTEWNEPLTSHFAATSFIPHWFVVRSWN